ncbi:MAG: GTPase Era, partial [Myxococcota bacterium]|nr:GTPase Era [Myxococcota bacterium]
GIRARSEIEQLLGVRVYLALWVKVEPKWQKRPKRLAALGYS